MSSWGCITWASGGIGIRGGLKIRWSKQPCGFDSHLAHHTKRPDIPGLFVWWREVGIEPWSSVASGDTSFPCLAALRNWPSGQFCRRRMRRIPTLPTIILFEITELLIGGSKAHLSLLYGFFAKYNRN
jgi:hypothetical protein